MVITFWFLFQMFVPDPVIKSVRNFLWHCFQLLSMMPYPCHQAADCPNTISEENLLDAEVGRSLNEFVAISTSACTRGSPASSAVTLLQVGTHQSRFRSLLYTAFNFSGRRETARKIINLFRRTPSSVSTSLLTRLEPSSSCPRQEEWYSTMTPSHPSSGGPHEDLMN